MSLRIGGFVLVTLLFSCLSSSYGFRPVDGVGHGTDLRRNDRGTRCGSLGDMSPFDWSGSRPYVAYGRVIQRVAQGPGEGGPYGLDESVMVIDPERELIFQTAGAAGGKSWYSPNGTYLLLPPASPGGPELCLYTEAGYAEERANYLVYVNLLHKKEGEYTYGGTPVDAASCQQRSPVTLVVDRENRVTGMLVVFAIQPDGVTKVQETAFAYDHFSYDGVAESVDPLPPQCAEPLPLCAVLYPNGPFIF